MTGKTMSTTRRTTKKEKLAKTSPTWRISKWKTCVFVCLSAFTLLTVLLASSKITFAIRRKSIAAFRPLNLGTLWNRLVRRRNTPVPFCEGIIQNKTEDIQSGLKYMENHSNEYIADETYTHIVGRNNCARFRRSSGYARQPLSQTESKFSLAYSIIMHKDAEQVERLLRAIYMPQNYYCIHVDKKSPQALQAAMGKIAECFSNVFIATQPVDVRWGHPSLLQADINCMKDLLRYKNWRYFINLTGQEFPLVTNRQIVDHFSKLNNTNCISSGLEDGAEFISRTKYKWDKNRRTSQLKGSPPYNMTLTKGSLHNFLTRDFVDYVINNDVPRHFLKWLQDTWAPEETFFASLQHNKHLGAPGCQKDFPRSDVKFNYRYVWWRVGDRVCAGKWVRDVCVTGIGDLHKAIRSSGLFINKLYLDFQPLALDCLEEYHRNLTQQLKTS